MAAIELQPEYARPTTKRPLTIVPENVFTFTSNKPYNLQQLLNLHTAVPNFLTLVRDIFSDCKR